MRNIHVTDQQFDHILAGLRALELAFEGGDERLADVATNEGTHARLQAEDLDQLARDLNMGRLEGTVGTVLSHFGAKTLAAEPHLRAYADQVETDDELEVDDDPIVSEGPDGAFVLTWTWVSRVDAGVPYAA